MEFWFARAMSSLSFIQMKCVSVCTRGRRDGRSSGFLKAECECGGARGPRGGNPGLQRARYWMLGAGALGRPRGMEWGRRREEGSGWGTHVYLWRIHFDIWQN